MVDVEVVPINPDNVFDRLKLCWGHLDDWRRLEIVKKSKQWLDKANATFTPTTFIAYKCEMPVGMIEFLPEESLRKLGLWLCRIDAENKEKPERYTIKEFENYLFISCLLISKDNQRKGIGTALLSHFLNSEVFNDYDGSLVYVRERSRRWDKHIHWPAGPKEFYLKAGFNIEKTLDDPTGHLLCYRIIRV